MCYHSTALFFVEFQNALRDYIIFFSLQQIAPLRMQNVTQHSIHVSDVTNNALSNMSRSLTYSSLRYSNQNSIFSRKNIQNFPSSRTFLYLATFWIRLRRIATTRLYLFTPLLLTLLMLKNSGRSKSSSDLFSDNFGGRKLIYNDCFRQDAFLIMVGLEPKPIMRFLNFRKPHSPYEAVS